VVATEDEIRDARHAYYANTSYFDDKIGELLQALADAQLLENTIVIVTSDHGDMLGERGLWYKMNFFEHSARVPLLMAGPGVAHGTAQNACSLLDLLPTMMDIGALTGATKPEYGQAIGGRSLLPLAMGQADPVDEAIGEYCAEMTGYPVIMIRRGRYKFVYCESDPPMLFDLVADPDELVNLAKQNEHDGVLQNFLAEVQQRWNSQQIRADVIASQKQRRAVHAAMEVGDIISWDYNPPRDASQEYVRNHMDWTIAAAKTRFPPLRK
jgi:choline-sulfatase